MVSTTIRTNQIHAERRGFTLVELLMAMTLGLLVLGIAVTFLMTQLRTLEGSAIREDVTRNGRYISVALRRDVQKAGILIESTSNFGTVAAWSGTNGDTLVVLRVPHLPAAAPPHNIDPPSGTNNPLPAGGTCGQQCIDVVKNSGEPFELEVGDLARLQVGASRRLILVEDITQNNDTSVAVSWTAADTLLRREAGLSGGLLLDRYNTYVQKLAATIYYLDDKGRLNRAVRLNPNGSPDGEILAYGVESFEVQIVFADGDVLDQANPFDSDVSNDYDDIIGVRVQATLKADRVDPRVNQGKLVRKSYYWEISPRNLRYEKNRS